MSTRDDDEQDGSLIVTDCDHVLWRWFRIIMAITPTFYTLIMIGNVQMIQVSYVVVHNSIFSLVLSHAQSLRPLNYQFPVIRDDYWLQQLHACDSRSKDYGCDDWKFEARLGLRFRPHIMFIYFHNSCWMSKESWNIRKPKKLLSNNCSP